LAGSEQVVAKGKRERLEGKGIQASHGLMGRKKGDRPETKAKRGEL